MFVPHQLGSSSAGRALKARIQTHLSDLCPTHSNGQSGMLVLCMYFKILSVYFAFSPTQTLPFRSPMFVRQSFSKPQIASFKALQRRIWWFCKGQKETHVSLVSVASGIIWTYCEGNAASVRTLKRFRRTRTDVTTWNRVEAPPLRADRRATRQHELFLLIKIHEHVSVFVCLLDSLREQMKTVPMLQNVNASSALISSRSVTLELPEGSAL